MQRVSAQTSAQPSAQKRARTAGGPRRVPEPGPLQAYLASALTGLSPAARETVFEVSDLVAKACQSCDVTLYEPRKITDPVHHAHVPDREVFRLDRRRVVRSDLLIYLAHEPSTGAGQELVLAREALVPILVVAERGQRVSRMVTGMPGITAVLDYADTGELEAALLHTLGELKPQLLHRKSALAAYDLPRLGARLRALRESRGMTEHDVAAAMSVPGTLTADQVRELETASDREGNLSLLLLSELAAALGVDARDLL